MKKINIIKVFEWLLFGFLLLSIMAFNKLVASSGVGVAISLIYIVVVIFFLGLSVRAARKWPKLKHLSQHECMAGIYSDSYLGVRYSGGVSSDKYKEAVILMVGISIIMLPVIYQKILYSPPRISNMPISFIIALTAIVQCATLFEAIVFIAKKVR